MSRIYWFTALFLIFSVARSAWAQRNSALPLVALSQGISSPTGTSLLNFDHGFAYQNPAGAALMDRAHISLEGASSSSNGQNNTSMGFELGAGNKTFGADVGYYKNNCDGCDGRFAFAGGYNSGALAMGLGYREKNRYSLGVLINPEGKHRFGVTADLIDNAAPATDVKQLGVGYSYVGESVGFALDASKIANSPELASDKIIVVSPGLMLKADKFALSVSYDNYMNDDTKLYESKAWVGFGFGGASTDMHFAVYKDYGADWTVVWSLFF